MLLLSLPLTLSFACLSSIVLADIAPYNASRLYDLGIFGAYPHRKFMTVDYEAPRVNIKQWSDQCEDGRYILLTPRGRYVSNSGPMLLDNKGNMVWSGKEFGMVSDLKVQRYRGEEYLTFWTGHDDGTHGHGVYHMLNSSYDVVRTTKPAGNLLGDLHEFTITDAGTALMTVYSDPEQADLSAFGRTKPGWIKDSMFQEIDLETGKLIFQWKASDHYSISETLAPIDKFGYTKENAFEYFHINSVDKDDVGNYYISSRYMQTVTCISPTGKILWKLGGKNNDFIDLSGGAATNFSWQHHARWHPGDRITLFDNGAFNWLFTAEHSRGLHVQLHTKNMTAEFIHDYIKPGVLAHSQGSVQLIPETGNVFIGWGHSSAHTEFAENGSILCDVHFGPSAFFGFGWAKSYRSFKANWVGKPRTMPVIAMKDGALYVSWNGATEVVNWSLEVSDNGNGVFNNLQKIPKDGFETRIPTDHLVTRHNRGMRLMEKVYYRVSALDKDGNHLATSKTINAATRHLVSEDIETIGSSVNDTPILTIAGVILCILCTLSVVLRKFRTLVQSRRAWPCTQWDVQSRALLDG